MRVITGTARGIPLTSGKADLRPTTDRAREAIFSSLGDRIGNARILDLFAGTGALSIEALSRGAHSALLVDHASDAVNAIKENLAKTRLHAQILRKSVWNFLNDPPPADPFDLIFADPPYGDRKQEESDAQRLVRCPTLPGFLNPQGMLVLEKRRHPALQIPDAWMVQRSGLYGDSEILFLSQKRSPFSSKE